MSGHLRAVNFRASTPRAAVPRAALLLAVVLAWPSVAAAQPLGTFRWQLQPYCNIVSVAVTQTGSIYRVEGTDDQCGAGADLASVIGTAFPNPNGSIGLGLNIVSSPGGVPVPVNATISLATLSGTWNDGAGHSGTFTFTPGAGTGGSPRPEVAGAATIPTVFRLEDDGGFVAGGTLNTGVIPASGLGTRMMWHPRKAAFRAGHVTIPAWDDANVGLYSTAFGLNTVAAGASSIALGEETVAGGQHSVAYGYNTVASGTNSLAGGDFTTASGANSIALGHSTTASGPDALSMGSNTLASGAYAFAGGANAIARATSSFAYGNAEVAANAHGSFVFGDVSTSSRILADIAGQFKVRASGGVRFATNASETAGVQMVGGSSQWLQLSDVNAKHQFRELSGEGVLAKIARMPVMEWSYKAQDASIRHVGPTAQDFHAAFGLGEDPRYIGSVDADGVALAAIRALEARSRAQAEENAAQREEIGALRDELNELRQEIERLRVGRRD